jgi:hypothetical protein
MDQAPRAWRKRDPAKPVLPVWMTRSSTRRLAPLAGSRRPLGGVFPFAGRCARSIASCSAGGDADGNPFEWLVLIWVSAPDGSIADTDLERLLGAEIGPYADGPEDDDERYERLLPPTRDRMAG